MAITNEPIKGGLKTVFDGTGTGQEFYVANVVHAADFTTGTGVGTVQLEMNMAGDWIRATAETTADTAALVFANGRPAVFRWSCTVFTSGTIACYLR